MLDILGLDVDIADDAGKLKLSTTKEADMKNADMPAMPSGKVCDVDENGWAKEFDSSGLTKREMMAMHMMASIQASGGIYDRFELMAKDAVVMADTLLTELEKQQ